MMDLAARLEAARIDGLEPGELIRHVPGKRALLHGCYQGRRVVIRLNLTPENGATEKEWAEMQRLWPHMATGDLRIPEPILVAPGAGIILLEHIPGTPLLQLMQSLEPTARCDWLTPAAAWLRKSTAVSEDHDPARPENWIARAEAASAKQPFAQLRALESEILGQMRRLAPMVAATPWRTAICHGDFHPNNLIADGARLTGIDLGGSRRMPLLKDIARFAMHMGRRRVRLSGQICLGVDRACLAAFAATFEMTAVERGAVLPFFLAVEALIRVETRALPDARIRRAERMYRALVQDLAVTSDRMPLI